MTNVYATRMIILYDLILVNLSNRCIPIDLIMLLTLVQTFDPDLFAVLWIREVVRHTFT